MLQLPSEKMSQFPSEKTSYEKSSYEPSLTRSLTSVSKPTPIILYSKEQKDAVKLRMQVKKEKEQLRALTLVQSTEALRSGDLKTKLLVEKIHRKFSLEKKIIRNVIAYAKCLPRFGSTIIDKNIFVAEMKRHFNLTDSVLIDRMYLTCCREPMHCKVTIERYCELICIFLDSNRDLKLQLAFRVYNAREDGFLNKQDIIYFVKPMVQRVSTGHDSEERILKDFVRMLMSVVDQDGDELVDLNEFRELVKNNVLMMQCLGPCLPDEQYRLAFLDLISDKRPEDVALSFRHERRLALKLSPLKTEISVVQKYYPVKLELS